MRRFSFLHASESAPMMIAMFVLGACATAVVQSSASRDSTYTEKPASPPLEDPYAELRAKATVVPLAEAPRATAPHGKASITHLARGENAYIGMLHMDPDAAVPSHRDPTEEFIHVLEGGGSMTVDGQTFEITAGTTIYMPADAEVSFQNGPTPMRAIQVFAGPEPAAKYDAWNAEN